MGEREPSEVLAVTEIKDVCYFERCSEPAVAVATYHSQTERDVVLVWLCERHGSTFSAPDATTDVLVQEISRTCRQGAPDASPCGGYATHVVVVGRQYEDERSPEIRVTSSCMRHAGAVETR